MARRLSFVGRTGEMLFIQNNNGCSVPSIVNPGCVILGATVAVEVRRLELIQVTAMPIFPPDAAVGKK